MHIRNDPHISKGLRALIPSIFLGLPRWRSEGRCHNVPAVVYLSGHKMLTLDRTERGECKTRCTAYICGHVKHAKVIIVAHGSRCILLLTPRTVCHYTHAKPFICAVSTLHAAKKWCQVS